MTDDKRDYLGALRFGSYMTIQSALLFAHYGLRYEMPWWVTWFPSLWVGGWLVVVGLVMLTVMFAAASTE